ncbi:MAG: hypothetical protein ABIS38_05780 [Sphingomicrobium sp.]
MARYETDFGAAAPEPLSLTQLLELLGPAAAGDTARKDAIACFLAGAEGWEQALQRLRGAFADDATGLSGEQAE